MNLYSNIGNVYQLMFVIMPAEVGRSPIAEPPKLRAGSLNRLTQYKKLSSHRPQFNIFHKNEWK